MKKQTKFSNATAKIAKFGALFVAMSFPLD